MAKAKTYLFHPGPKNFDFDKTQELLDNGDDLFWDIIDDVRRGYEKAEKVSEIDLNKPGLYIEDLEMRTYYFVYDGEIAFDCTNGEVIG